ncbi:MAG: hypothetical protein H0U06_06385 [Solirubrobacterales bacterium]|nr:hypothetical protein [Solirubrobacterales bacterium]
MRIFEFIAAKKAEHSIQIMCRATDVPLPAEHAASTPNAEANYLSRSNIVADGPGTADR